MRSAALAALLLLPACDKVFHFGAGFAVSGFVTEVTQSRPMGCAAAVVVGLAKEAVDFIPDPFDLAATIAGGCIAQPHMTR